MAGYIISGGGTGDLTLYNTETGKEVRQFVGHTSIVGPSRSHLITKRWSPGRTIKR